MSLLYTHLAGRTLTRVRSVRVCVGGVCVGGRWDLGHLHEEGPGGAGTLDEIGRGSKGHDALEREQREAPEGRGRAA